MKIIYFYQDESEKEYFSNNFEGNDVTFLEGTIQDNPNFSDKEAEVISIFIKSNIGAEEMNKFPNLKLIATRSTGFNHIDLDEAKKRGIVISNVPHYGENTVAEFSFSLLLALSRNIYNAYNNILENGNFSQKGLKGFDLKGKTIGIVGAGNIGKHAIKIAKGFDLNVIVFDVHQDENFAKEAGFEYVGFDELLQNSDIICLYVPLNPHTHHLINKDNISQIKKGAYLINTSRGEVVETVSIVEALKKGILAGAGLDVLEEEGFMEDKIGLIFDEHPNPEELKNVLANQYLIDHPQVIITPHIAFDTQEAVERIFATNIENIKNFEKGGNSNIVG